MIFCAVDLSWLTFDAVIIIMCAFFVFLEIYKGIDYLVKKYRAKVAERVQEVGEQKSIEDRLGELTERLDTLSADIKDIKKDLVKLREAEVEAIRSWMTRMHAETTKRGVIDIHDLENVEDRYKTYKESGGNSFVLDLVEDMRKLPIRK